MNTRLLHRYLFFISGQIGMMLLARFFFQWNPKYIDQIDATKVTLFAAGLVGWTLLGFRIFDGITDPLAGTLSDRWVRKRRPRQQLLWFSFLIPGIGLILCFLADHSMGASLRWALLASGLFVFFVGYTFYAIPYWSLVGDYAGDCQKSRRIYSNLLGAGLMIATAIGFLATGALISKYGFTQSAIIVAAICSVLMILPIFAAPKSSLPSASSNDEDKPPSLWQGMKIAFRHRRFVALATLFSGSQMSFTIMTGAAAYIAQDILGGEEKHVANVFGPLIGMAIPGFLIVPWISRKWGWEKGMLVASLGLAVVYSLSGSLGTSVIGSPMFTAGLLFGIGGPMVAVLLGLEGEALIDCATEEGDTKLIGIYWGVFNFIVKILNGTALVIMLQLVAWKGSVGTVAVRAMSYCAGGCLAIGVTAYFLIRLSDRRAKTA